MENKGDVPLCTFDRPMFTNGHPFPQGECRHHWTELFLSQAVPVWVSLSITGKCHVTCSVRGILPMFLLFPQLLLSEIFDPCCFSGYEKSRGIIETILCAVQVKMYVGCGWVGHCGNQEPRTRVRLSGWHLSMFGLASLSKWLEVWSMSCDFQLHW